MGKKIGLLWLLILLTSVSFATVTTRADRLEMYDDESLVLEISVSPSGQISQRDIAALESIFTIISRSQSSQTSTVNGKRSSVTNFQFKLVPKEVGLLGIPVFTVNNEQSDAFFVNVLDSKKRTNQLDNDAIDFNVNVSEEQPYVDQPFTLTIEIAYRIGLGGQFAAMDFPNFETEILSEDNSVETRNGRSYNIYTRVIKLTPQRAGNFTMPIIEFRGQYQLSSNQPAKRINLNARPAEIQVRPIPSNYPAGAYWLPTESFSLSDNLPNALTIEEKEHLSWSISQTIEGLSASELPDPLANIEKDNRFQLYRDNPIFTDNAPLGTRKDITALTIKDSSVTQFTLPGITIPWWNIKEDKLEYATLPERTISVTPSSSNTFTPVATNSEPVVVTEGNGNTVWKWATGILAVALSINLVVSAMLLRTIKSAKRTNDGPKPNTAELPSKISQLSDIYPALLKLLQQNQLSMSELKQVLDNSAKQQLASLEQQYYGKECPQSISFSEAQALLKDCKKAMQQANNKAATSGLSLYPS
jgi:hypothetical protein